MKNGIPIAMPPFLKRPQPFGFLFLPLRILISKKCDFFTQKTYFFTAKNLIFSGLLSQGAKIKRQKAAT
ncbi:MAG: hypothetical protein IJ250_02875 [Bacteroidales bacterium]|nr:hypothetical protein [Bacteroidales bacterium]